MSFYRLSAFAALAGVAVLSAQAASFPVTFIKLTGLTGDAVGGQTGVYRADLSGIALSSILSISITDATVTGGSAGQFTGFDLDGIKLSNTSVGTAADAKSLVGLNLFSFSGSGVLFTPGSQWAPVDSNLFGSTGSTIDNAVATLGEFDAYSSTVTPSGFASLGQGGKIAFNLTAPVSPTGLYLYIGEVGDNGEVAAGSITVSDTQQAVPEPVTMGLAAVGLGTAMLRRRKRS